MRTAKHRRSTRLLRVTALAILVAAAAGAGSAADTGILDVNTLDGGAIYDGGLILDDAPAMVISRDGARLQVILRDEAAPESYATDPYGRALVLLEEANPGLLAAFFSTHFLPLVPNDGKRAILSGPESLDFATRKLHGAYVRSGLVYVVAKVAQQVKSGASPSSLSLGAFWASLSPGGGTAQWTKVICDTCGTWPPPKDPFCGEGLCLDDCSLPGSACLVVTGSTKGTPAATASTIDAPQRP